MRWMALCVCVFATGCAEPETSAAGSTDEAGQETEQTDDQSADTGSDETTGDSTGDTSDGTDTSGGNDETTPTDGDSGSTDSGTTTEPEPEPVPDTLRFVVLGDAGEGNQNQYDVADAMQEVCALHGGCEFALYLGDNFYDDGIDETLCIDDPQFQEKFELPYANLEFPFYVVVGNHDYGTLPIALNKTNCEVLYHEISDKWHMPARYYAVEHDNALFMGLDTNALMVDQFILGDVDPDAQADWFDQQVSESDALWKFAFGHHPYLSNGSHGNAGNYEGLSWLPIVNGENIEDFVDESVCGKIDIYFSGHDHTRQWLEPSCGTEFVVSGAAAKTTELSWRDDNATFFDDDRAPGFLYIEIDDNLLIGRFYDKDGTMDFERTVVK